MRAIIPIAFHRKTTNWARRLSWLGNLWKAVASALAVSSRADQTKEALARRIIATAKTGERDVNRLKEDAVAFVQAKYGS
jgi:hypothetical protein